MPRLRVLNPDEVPEDVGAAFDRFMKARGNIPNMFRTMARRPQLMLTMEAHMNAVINTGTVDTALKELVIVRTSANNKCAYWIASHSAALRRLGTPEEKISGVQRAIVDTELFSEKELASLELADRMTWSGHAVDDQLWNRLLTYFDQEEIVEVVCAIGLFNYFNRVNDALRMEITR